MLSEFKIEQPIEPGKKIALLSATLLAVMFLTVLVFYFTKINQASSSTSLPTQVSIAKGLSIRQIGKQLENQNIINSPWAFIIYVKISKASSAIKAGDYILDPKMSIVEIVDILTAGRVAPSEKKVTIIEGWSNKQISEYLDARKLFTRQQLDAATAQDYDFKFSDQNQKKNNYQGFLFPDTYQLSKNAQASELVQKMLKNFEKKMTGQMLADINTRNLKLFEVIITASIIEKEVGRTGNDLSLEDLTAMQKERRLVASVFYNRLKLGMPLQSDATVNYITGKVTRQIVLADAKIKSPYNTYLVLGLPPTPIGNPGIDSILAAIYPANSDYLYFLNKPDGEAVFAKTLEEHNANKTRFLK